MTIEVNRVPSEDELDELVEHLVEACGDLDALKMALSRLDSQPEGEPLTAEEAWRLVRAAEACRWRGDLVREYAEQITDRVHAIYQEEDPAA